MFFGVGGAVWVVDGNCTVFIDTGQNDKVTRVGKITRIHGTDQGDAGPQGGKDVFLCYRDVFCCEAQPIGVVSLISGMYSSEVKVSNPSLENTVLLP